MENKFEVVDHSAGVDTEAIVVSVVILNDGREYDCRFRSDYKGTEVEEPELQTILDKDYNECSIEEAFGKDAEAYEKVKMVAWQYAEGALQDILLDNLEK